MVRGRYISPHAHRGESESFHMLEGELTVVLFANDGRIDRVVDLSANGPQALYWRLAASTCHKVVLSTRLAVFDETTNGLFIPSDVDYPIWSPDERELIGASAFLDHQLEDVGEFRRSVVL